MWIVAPVAAFVLLAGACGSSGTETTTASTASPSSVETTTTTTPPTTTTATTVAPAPTGAKPTCEEVDAFIAQLSPSDRALLSKAPMLMVRRGPSGGDTWQIWSMTDVKGQLNPELTVYYNWSPATGLSDAVMIPFGQDDFVNDPSAQTLLMMKCMEATRNLVPLP